MNDKKFECRICRGTASKSYLIREMMFGLNDQFVYWECDKCGCLQIEKYPSNISEYYPGDYYSFEKIDYTSYNLIGIKKKIKVSTVLYNQLVFNDLLSHFGVKLRMPCNGGLKYFEKINAKPWSKILDIGCGNALFLCELYKIGFTSLTGVDKFIQKQFTLFDTIKVLKKEIHELDEKFDIITMNHVLEHMPSQFEIMKSVYEILNKKGKLIIRIPIKNETWDKYKENWVQIDAPRHFYIHTIESIETLAIQTGFILEDVEFDSYSLQFWGSEQYKLNIPLRRDNRSYADNPGDILFSSAQIEAWEAESVKLNEAGKGDQAIFILKKCKVV